MAHPIPTSRFASATGDPFEAIVEQLGVPLVVARALDERVRYANPAAEELFGLAPGALVGREVGGLFLDPTPLRRLFRSLARAGQATPAEIPARRADGAFLPVEIALDALFFHGEPVVAITLRDLRQVRRLEGDLRVQAQVERLLSSVSTRLLSLQPNAIEGGLAEALEEIAEVTLADSGFVVLLDAERHPQRVLRWLSELHDQGSPPAWESLMARDPRSLVDALDDRRVIELSSIDAERRAVLGRSEPFALILVPIRYGDALRGLLGLASLNPMKRWQHIREPLATVAQIFANALQRRDAEAGLAAERQRAERERQKANKLEAVGILAGGIAHDFRNVLLVIQGNASLGRHCIEKPDKLAELLGEIEAASERAKDLTEQLLTFSKGGEPVKQTVALPEILRQSVRLSLPGSRVVCEVQIAEDLWPVEADVGQLNQVLGNLLINANQAMSDGGRVRLEAVNVERSAVPSETSLDTDAVRLTVSDEGIGITPENLSRIFDPYFTTKDTGTGLGLATSHSIIQKHGGHLAVSSEPGSGATFTIHLPASGGTALHNIVSDGGLTRGEGRVLVVDDEAPVRRLVIGMLERLGYDAVAVADGDLAISAYADAQTAGEPFDAVLLDLTIPGSLGGREAMGRLRQLDPDARGIVASGYSKDPVMASYSEYGFADVLRKPYALGELSRVLARLLRTESK